MPNEDIVRVLRVIEYSGPRRDVEEQIAGSLHGQRRGIRQCIIRAATVGVYPELLEAAEPDTDAARAERVATAEPRDDQLCRAVDPAGLPRLRMCFFRKEHTGPHSYEPTGEDDELDDTPEEL